MKTRRITLGILVLLTVLAILDARFFGFAQPHFNRPPIYFEVKNNETSFRAERVQEFQHSQAQFSKLVIHNQQGQVKIEATSGDVLTVTARIVAKDLIKYEAETKLKEWEVQESIVGDQISYKLNRLNRQSLSGGQEVEVIYSVHVPQGMDIVLDQSYGMVDGEGLTGNLEIKAQFSTVSLQNLQGSSTIVSRFSTIDLQSVSGSVAIDDSYSTINLGLNRIDEGYDFDVALNYGTLKGNASLDIKQDKNVIRARGQYGEGMHPVVIKSDFSTVTLVLM